MYSVEFTRSAIKDLSDLPASAQSIVKRKIGMLARAPAHMSGVKALKGERNSYRLRVGDYRVVYYLEHDRLVIVIVRVAHRKEVYR